MTFSASPLLDSTPAFTLKGGSFTATLIELLSVDLVHVEAQLQARLLDAAAFLLQSPVILSVEKVAHETADWSALLGLCQQMGIRLVGVRAPLQLQSGIEALGVPVLPPPRRKGNATEEISVAPAPVVAASQPTRVINQPVRGGQQIYAPGDLIVLAPVSAGAEVLADGHIHIYAPLRGRALAGVQGNLEARIFCQSLEAEMISVAGRYRVAEELRRTTSWGKPSQIQLQGETLALQAL
ncbi:MAG: septum site-determining protein MinC [Moraxellaceae bacterium]|nr:septum site-determining protein MinC [Moraxellaceae bacterium]